MPENSPAFSDFIMEVDPRLHGFVQQTDEQMTQYGCKLKIATSKSGYVVSYTHAKSKKVILNFVFRKSGLVVRIYGDSVGQYLDLLEALPDKMRKVIEKAPSCKRFEDPPRCNSKCGGYVFILGGTQYQKCRYNCFMFGVDHESIPFIDRFIENEVGARNAAQKQ